MSFPDLGERGLEFRVSEKGERSWSLRYRAKDGEQRRMTLGPFPAVKVTDARRLAGEIKTAVRSGVDPAAEKKRERAAAMAQPMRTFGDLFAAYIAACEAGTWRPRNKRKRARTIADERGSYRRHIERAFGDLRLEEIKRSDVRNLLRGMFNRGIGAQTLRAQQVIRQAFAYALAEDRLAINPAAGLEPMAPINARTRTLTDPEIATLWRALQAPKSVMRPPLKEGGSPRPLHVSRPVAIVIQLCALLLQRKGETVGMRIDELELSRGIWSLGGDRMKGGRPHIVPLPTRAVELIKEAITLSQGRRTADGKPSPYVFPSPRDASKPILPHSISHAMLGVIEAIGIPPASPHDLRRTGSTALTSERLGVSPFIRSKVLGHSSDTGGGAAVSSAHYDLNEYLAAKRDALAAWENLLRQIVGEIEPASNVVSMQRAGA